MMHSSSTRLPRLLPMFFAILGILCSLCFSFLVLPHLSGPLHVNIDPDKLGELGRNLAEGKGFSYGTGSVLVPAFDRAPVYPILLMILFWITGGDPLTLIQIVQAVFHGCTGFLLYRIGVELFERRTALLAQALQAVHPILLWYTARIWIESTNTLLITALVLALIMLWRRSSERWVAACGVLVSLAALTKSVILFLPPLILVFALVRKQWAYARALALVCLIGLVLISPWTIRNTLLSGRLVLVHTSLGLNLVQGEAISEQWTSTPFSTLAIWEEGRKQTELLLSPAGLRPESPEGDAMLTGTILHRWWSSPVTLVRHAATNALTFWYLSESPLKSGVVIAMQIPLLILAGLGLQRMWQRGFSAHILLVAVVSFWLVHALIVGWLRYGVPVLPILILIAAVGAEKLLLRVSHPATA